jgi:hypothetical protein
MQKVVIDTYKLIFCNPMNQHKEIKLIFLSQPYCWKSGRMTFTFPKWGFGSLSGLPKLQSSILRVKTPYIEALFISLKSYQSVDVENGLAWMIWTFAAQVTSKGNVESQIGSFTPNH